MSCEFLKDGEEVQTSDSEIEAKDAKWKLIGGLALMNVYDPEKQSTKFDDFLLVADTASQCIKCVSNQTFRVYGGLLEKHFLLSCVWS